jgi:hypothetical protein
MRFSISKTTLLGWQTSHNVKSKVFLVVLNGPEYVGLTAW